MNKQLSIAVLALIGATCAVKLEREPLRSWSPSPKPGGHKVDYFVPHFGTDNEINNSLDSAKLAEAQLGHEWTESSPDDIKRNYFVPHFGTDQDILDTSQSIKAGEKQHNH